MLRKACILGDPQTKGDKIRKCCLTLAYSRAERGRKYYVTPEFSNVSDKKKQNQKTKPTLGVTPMPLVSQIWVSSTARLPNNCTMLSAPP